MITNATRTAPLAVERNGEVADTGAHGPPATRRGLLRIVAATLLTLLAALGFATTASATAPVPPPVTASASSQYDHALVGSFVTFVNDSPETVTLNYLPYEKSRYVDVTLEPGDRMDLRGSNCGADDVKATIKTVRGDLPLYAHNPAFNEAYVQVHGHKWLGNGTDTIEGHTFSVTWDGHHKWADDSEWKMWTMTYKG